MDDMNSGYVGWSMSRNAADAYESGEMPKSKWTKAAMVEALRRYCDDCGLVYDDDVEALTKPAMFARFFECTSWHHTGRFCNETAFYGINGAAAQDAFREMTAAEETAAEKARKAERDDDEKRREAAERLDRQRLDERAEFLAAHGFGIDSFAAFVEEHPDCVEEFASKRGNECYRIVSGKFSGMTATKKDAPRQTIIGYESKL